MITKQQLAGFFDHTLLKAYVTNEDFKKLCEESTQYGFKMVAVNSSAAKICKDYLKDTQVHVGAAISFPLGQTSIATKVFETEDAIRNGADEIDYVINIVELKNKNYDYIQTEMEKIVSVCRQHRVICKVIFENCYLTRDEIQKLCEIALKVRPDFVKTSTGFGTGGATVEDVAFMKSIVGDAVKVKAAGGIRDLDTCLAMINAGAERIGTSSSIKILEEYEKRMNL